MECWYVEMRRSHAFDTLARMHMNQASTQSHWHINHAGTEAHWHADQVTMLACMTRNLANLERVNTRKRNTKKSIVPCSMLR